MSDKINDNHPLIKLLRITMAENGNDLWSTRGLNDAQDLASGGSNQIVTKSTLTSSLLIESLIQQLCTMFEVDPVKRNKLYFSLCDRLRDMSLIDNSYNMDEYEMMRGKYQRALYNLVTVARAAAGCQKIIQGPNVVADVPRYKIEFEELNFIGSGSFGHVYKARHRLDGHDYAIKKIYVRPDKINDLLQHLEEVRTLAKLNHTNIVSYKGAWIEQISPETFPSYSQTKNELSNIRVSRSSGLSVQHTRSHSVDYCRKKSIEMRASRSNPSKNDDDNQQQLQQNSSETNSRNGYLLSKLNQIYELDIVKSSCEISKQHTSTSGIFHSHDIITERFEQLNSTINIIGRRIEEQVSSRSSRVVEEGDSDVVSFRNDAELTNNDEPLQDDSNYEERTSSERSDCSESPEENVEDNRRICPFNFHSREKFSVLYIHMALCDQTLRQWIDKRIEPTPETTIMSILTQILAGLQYIHSRSMVHHDIKPSNIFITTSGQLHIQVGDFGLACPLRQDNHHPLGTQLYAAPEQLSGKCDPKSDVYSLGIILIELLILMKTTMERIHVISELKSGKTPKNLSLYRPKWTDLIKRLVNVDPTMRPSTTELLNDLSEDKDLKIVQLTTENQQKDSIIKNLELENQQLREQLSQLQAEINNCKVQN